MEQLDYRRVSADDQQRGGRLLAVGIWLTAASFVVAGVYVLMPGRSSHAHDRLHMICHSNLVQIGQACLLYANENEGRYPDRLEDVLLTQDVTPGVFVCPGSKDTPAPGRDLPTRAANLMSGGHCSYRYFGKGMTQKTIAADCVIACEVAVNHSSRTNVLYGDGHVDFVDVTLWRKILAEVNSGHNPPRPEKLK